MLTVENQKKGGISMRKKAIVWFLAFAFLSFVVTPEFVFAAGGFDIGPDIGPSGGQVAMIYGGIVVAVLIVVGLVYLAKKHPGTPTEQPQEQKQEAPQSLHFQQPDEQLTTPPGQIALLRW
jgi:hypothetical protein